MMMTTEKYDEYIYECIFRVQPFRKKKNYILIYDNKRQIPFLMPPLASNQYFTQ